MATRTITSTIKRSDGSGWAGAKVRFRLSADSYRASPAETYPIGDVVAVADAGGAMSVTLISGTGIVYRVTMPDDETFAIAVPDGSSVALETLRASYNGAPAAVNSVEDAIVSLYGGLPTARGAIAVQEGDATVVADLTHLDFDASDFVVSESPTGEANVSLAYGTSAGTPAEGNHSHTLDGLSDVAVTSPADGQNVRYNGSSWVNEYGSGLYVLYLARIALTEASAAEYEITNAPSGLTEVGVLRTRRWVDLTNARQVRLTCDVNQAGSSGTDLVLRYSTDNGSNWTSITEVTIDSTGIKDSGWVSLPAGAKAFVLTGLWTKDGNATADPQLNYAAGQYR